MDGLGRLLNRDPSAIDNSRRSASGTCVESPEACAAVAVGNAKPVTAIRKWSWPYRTNAMIQSLMGYAGFKRQCLSRTGPATAGASSTSAEEELNRLTSGHPGNHVYRIVNKRVVPGFKLYERLRLVTGVYPEPLQSFLDIGCCRGFYVLDAALRFHCPRAVGIDVYEPYVSAAQRAGKYLETPNASFHLASLEDVSNDPERFGGPFRVVLLIGTYHYLFWGSDACSTAYRSHDEILRRLSRVCADMLIFSGRTTMKTLPRHVKSKLDGTESDIPYTTGAFLQSAEKLFHVRHAGYLGTYPLLVMTKKHS